MSASDFGIDPPNSGVSVQSTSFDDGITEATLIFTVDANNVDGTFSIDIPDGSYTDDGNNGNSEITETEANAVLPIDITIDNIAPTITNPPAGDYPVTTQSFTLTIEFSEALQLTEVTGDVPILTSNEIVLTNATITNPTIDNNGNGGKGTAAIEITIGTGTEYPTITILGSAYSDTLGNTGESDYVLTIPLTSIWLTAGGTDCQNFAFDGGTGTEIDPYQISNICQLQNIDADNIMIDSVMHNNLLNKNYILIADIDANYTRNWDSEKGFDPIGDGSGTNPYTGIFDGNGYAIHNLYINRPNTDYVGLFAYIGSSGNGEVKKVAVVHADIVGRNTVGGIAGNISGSMRSSVVSGSISGEGTVGGLFGNENVGGNAKENNISSVSIKATANNAGIHIGSYSASSGSQNNLNNNIGVGSVLAGDYVGIAGTLLNSSVFNNNLGLASINGNIVGGLVGQRQQFQDNIDNANNNYWNTEISGQAQGVGTGSPSTAGNPVTSDVITDSTNSLSGLGFGDDGDWKDIDNFSYPLLKTTGTNGQILDATEQTVFIAHGLFRLATTDNAVITNQSVKNKVGNFLGGSVVQDDITLTASDFGANSALTAIDTNLEASNDVSRVDYFSCVDGSNATDVANGSDGEVLTTMTVGESCRFSEKIRRQCRCKTYR